MAKYLESGELSLDHTAELNHKYSRASKATSKCRSLGTTASPAHLLPALTTEAVAGPQPPRPPEP